PAGCARAFAARVLVVEICSGADGAEVMAVHDDSAIVQGRLDDPQVLDAMQVQDLRLQALEQGCGFVPAGPDVAVPDAAHVRELMTVGLQRAVTARPGNMDLVSPCP